MSCSAGRWWRLCIAAAATVIVGGCATGLPGAAPAAPVPASESVHTAAPANGGTPAAQPQGQSPQPQVGAEIDVELQWLLSFFSGTPVEIQRTVQGALSVVVPAEFCFYAKATVIKPPLAAVLEKVALSLRRQPLTRVTLLSAPADEATPASRGLAARRAAMVAKRLRSFGIAASRLAAPTAAADAAVRLLIEPSPG